MAERVEIVAKVLFDAHFWGGDPDPTWYRQTPGKDNVLDRDMAAGAFDRNRYMDTARKVIEALDAKPALDEEGKR
jgi:hypothetical protein